jgi:hypothetical protein
VRRLVLFALLVVLAAGCGARNDKPFTAQGTIRCLTKAGFQVSTKTSEIGFIAAVAPNGGLRATPKDRNVVTVAFEQDSASVPDAVAAFRKHASATLRPHFSDVVRTSRNAVMVWTTTPTDADDSTLEGCLAP